MISASVCNKSWTFEPRRPVLRRLPRMLRPQTACTATCGGARRRSRQVYGYKRHAPVGPPAAFRHCSDCRDGIAEALNLAEGTSQTPSWTHRTSPHIAMRLTALCVAASAVSIRLAPCMPHADVTGPRPRAGPRRGAGTGHECGCGSHRHGTAHQHHSGGHLRAAAPAQRPHPQPSPRQRSQARAARRLPRRHQAPVRRVPPGRRRVVERARRGDPPPHRRRGPAQAGAAAAGARAGHLRAGELLREHGGAVVQRRKWDALPCPAFNVAWSCPTLPCPASPRLASSLRSCCNHSGAG